ncbi:MAG: hypothetical protein ACRCX8_14150 [Sarcina sp.]
MSKIVINNKDIKNKRNILEDRTLDVGSNIPIIPVDFAEMITLNRSSRSITRFSFEVSKYGVIENILDDYIVFLSNPEFLHNVRFTPEQANVLKLNVNALANSMYGDINMAWCIPYLNDLVKHPSDLTYELLTKDGLKAFNTQGINALRELLTMKRISEENSGTSVDKEPMFNLDSF